MAPVTFSVRTLSGQDINVFDKPEKDFYEEAQTKYLTQNKFTESSDLRTLERLLGQELLCFRWQRQLTQGLDQYGMALTSVDEDRLRKSIKEALPGISDMQKDLGLTKSQRDKAQYESVGTYLAELQIRAKEMGVKREKELATAITLCKTLFAHVGSFQRGNEEERQKLGFKDDAALVKWVWEVMKPEFDAIDEYFQQNSQRYWVRKV